jgi:hypothetical protein
MADGDRRTPLASVPAGDLRTAGCHANECTKRSCSLGEAVMVMGWRRLLDDLVEPLMSP